MERQENKYKYAQLETYKEVLELSHLKRKTLIVNILMVVLSMFLVYFLLTQNVDKGRIYPALIVFSIVLMMNIMFSSLKHDQYNNLKLAMYFSIIGIYFVANILVFKFETPSIFTVLFLAYALTSIYQDFKAMLLSSIILFMCGTFFVLGFPGMFTMVGDVTEPDKYLILIFLLVFVLLLTLSSYILIKRKTFFYNQLASIKESEIRNIDLLNQVELIKTKTEKDYSSYYDSLSEFSKALSKKIGVDDLFGRRIELLKELKNSTTKDLSMKYPEFDVNEIQDLSLMEFELNDKITKLSLKASKSKNVKVTKKEIFNEEQFKSFDHFDDSNYTKIISFAVFYTLLKVNKPYLRSLGEDELRDILYNSEYFYRVDRDVMNIYLENNEVFDTIVNDYLKGGW